MEEMPRECLESHRWEAWLLFPDEVLIVPVTGPEQYETNAYDIQHCCDASIYDPTTYACSTWKHMRSTDTSSSSGRLRMKRLSHRGICQ